MVSAAAARYAKALADVVFEKGFQADPAQVISQLRSVEQLIQASMDLNTALESPAVPTSRKRAVMAKLMQPLGVVPQVRNFIFVVIDHRRIRDLSAMIEAFEGFIDERLGFVRADVSSARELTESQRAELEVNLSRLSGKKAKLRFTTDPSLVAGVVARLGSTVYDGSIRGQLDRLRVKLASQ